MVFVATVVMAQTPSFYRIIGISTYDRSTNSWADFQETSGLMGTKGNLVRIEVAEYNFSVQFDLKSVDKQETSEIVLVQYADVHASANVWYFFNKESNVSVVRVSKNGEWIQFLIGDKLNN